MLIRVLGWQPQHGGDAQLLDIGGDEGERRELVGLAGGLQLYRDRQMHRVIAPQSVLLDQ